MSVYITEPSLSNPPSILRSCVKQLKLTMVHVWVTIHLYLDVLLLRRYTIRLSFTCTTSTDPLMVSQVVSKDWSSNLDVHLVRRSGPDEHSVSGRIHWLS